ncbi:MAG TPA: helix-turn-helix domain-containing protein [Candidatus Limnocylindrales bacterium]|nr:helix-turn-helix domain-containing protein [Candidatus Limnocylindrales bacterium]
MTSSFTRQALRRSVAGLVRDTRETVGWSQRELGEHAGVSRDVVAGVETARVSTSLDNAVALLDALGLRYELVATAPFLADRRRQREPAHGLCSAYVARRLRSCDWVVEREVEVVHGRSHGWIDVLGFDPASATLVVSEIKTEIEDLGRIERTLGWYEREAWEAARRLGWRPRRVSGVLLLLATEANERRLLDNSSVVQAVFRVHADELLDGIDKRLALPHGRALALLDPRSRKRRWLSRPRVHSGRSRPPYADYADFMRTVRK